MIKELLEKVASQESLTLEEASGVMHSIMDGELNNSHLAGLLLALRTKGETAAEVAGFARAMKDRCIKISSPSPMTIDLCGTGGDYSGTFNISTAASFIAAGAGVPVAKHGNRSISSISGSADVLKELGINIMLSPDRAGKALNEIGIAFLFAPVYHPSMKNAAPVRSELGLKTIFNLLGPLSNPAGTKRQLIGTFSRKASEVMCGAAEFLNMEKVCFVNSENRFDEISLAGSTHVNEFSHESDRKEYKVDSSSFGYEEIDPKNILGGSPRENAEIILSILRDKKEGPAFKVAAANAAMALYCAGKSSSLKECRLLAEESVRSGNAYEKLKLLSSFGEMP